MNSPDPAKTEVIKTMRLAGKSIREIAKTTGFAMSTVERHLKILQLTQVHRPRVTEETQKERWKLAMPW